jgi:cytochrome P450
MSQDSTHVLEKNDDCPPPLVTGLPIIGNAIPLLTDALNFLRRTHEQYGDIYTVKAAHHKLVVMAGIEANRFIAGSGKDCFNSSGFWEESLTEMGCPHSFIGVDGEPHRYQRMLLMPHFSKSNFTPNLPQFAQIFQDTLATHYHAPTLVAPLFRHVLSQQIGSCMQGYQPTSDEVEALIYWENTALNACSFKKLPRFALRLPKYKAAKQKVKSLAEKIIKLEKPAGAASSYLDVVINTGQKKRPQWFTQGDVQTHAILPFMAGTDTVGAMLSFMLFELFKQPEIRRLLQEEVDNVFREGIPDVATLESMINLKNFAKEALRLYPTVYALRRTATRDFTFKDCVVRKGQHIIVFTTASHTDSTFFKDPYRFDIDRYKEPRSEHRAAAGVLAPFGSGPHTCMGAGLSNILLSLNLALLLFYVDVKPVNNLKKIKLDFSTPTMTLSKRFAIHIAPRSGGISGQTL